MKEDQKKKERERGGYVQVARSSSSSAPSGNDLTFPRLKFHLYLWDSVFISSQETANKKLSSRVEEEKSEKVLLLLPFSMKL